MIRFAGPTGSQLDVIVEDDGLVAYAYLRQDERIVGDVWLYNRGRAPLEPEWRDRTKMPFANPAGYVVPGVFPPIAMADEVTCTWSEGETGYVVDLYVRGQHHARLVPGAKPGWCRLAAVDGPVARRLESWHR